MSNTPATQSDSSPTEIRLQVLRNGYAPLPNLDKMCLLPGWPSVEITEEVIRKWGRSRRFEATGLRLQDGLMALDLDVNVPQEAFDDLADKLVDAFPVLEDALFRKGKGSKEAWFLRTSEPFGRIASGLFIDPEGDPEEGFRVEAYGGGSSRQFGAIGWHTKDELEYRWLDDRSPLNEPLAELPEIDKATVHEIVDFVHAWLAERYDLVTLHGSGENETEILHDLDSEMVFETMHDGDCTLDQLRTIGDGNCSASFCDGEIARNTRRCLFNLDHDGNVTIWDSMTGITHREASLAPIDPEERRRRLSEGFERLGMTLPTGDPEITDNRWRQDFLLTEQGGVRQNEANVAIRLQQDEWEGVFSVSTFDHNVYVMRPMPEHRNGMTYPRRLTDSDIIYVQNWLQHDLFPSLTTQKAKTGIIMAAEENTHHGPRDYLTSLKWDGVPRLAKVGPTYLGSPDNTYTNAVIRKWMISAVARIMQPGCKADHMLVLQGPQGVGKSSFLAALGGQWFGDDMPPVTSKDAKEWIRDQWIAEIAELGAISGKDVEHVKAFITTTSDKFRKSYGMVVETVPRQVIFAGSTNDAEFLIDTTGGRRFWPVEVTHVDMVALKRDKDQLWAEALVEYQSGTSWHLDRDADAELIALAGDVQEGARTPFIEEEPIRRWLRLQKAQDGLLAYDVATGGLGLEKGRMTAAMQHRIPRIMSGLGWVKERRSKYGAVWVRGPKAEPYKVPDPTTGTPAERAAKKAAAIGLEEVPKD